jgi:hypothetical protein
MAFWRPLLLRSTPRRTAFRSSSTVFSYDVFRHFRPAASSPTIPSILTLIHSYLFQSLNMDALLPPYLASFAASFSNSTSPSAYYEALPPLETFSYIERSWASWYLLFSSPALATGLLLFLSHEASFFPPAEPSERPPNHPPSPSFRSSTSAAPCPTSSSTCSPASATTNSNRPRYRPSTPNGVALSSSSFHTSSSSSPSSAAFILSPPSLAFRPTNSPSRRGRRWPFSSRCSSRLRIQFITLLIGLCTHRRCTR